jgi:hypothetical protein
MLALGSLCAADGGIGSILLAWKDLRRLLLFLRDMAGYNTRHDQAAGRRAT